MNPTPPAFRPRARLWTWLTVSFTAGCVLLVATVLNLITLSSDAAVLRRSIERAGELQLGTRVQFSSGPLVLGLVRGVAGLIDDVPAEARQALKAVRTASVGVYRLNAVSSDENRVRMFNEADTDLRARGWTRLVEVRSDKSTVIVYSTEEQPTGEKIRVCVAVCDLEQLVVASATLRPESLVELIGQHL